MNFSVTRVVQKLRFYQQCTKKKIILTSIYILKHVSMSQMINVCMYLPFPDITCRGTQYKFDSELWLINAWCIENLTELISSQCSNIPHMKKPDSWFLQAK